jgi:hypothetical protein
MNSVEKISDVFSKCGTLFCLFGLMFLVSSCSSDSVQKRVDRRTDIGGKMDENMRIRRDARDERYERQWDRMMN